MTQQEAPGPVALLEAAFQQTRKTVAGVKPDQMKKPTPCTEWDVERLLKHIIDGVWNLRYFLTESRPPTGAPQSPLEAYDTATGLALKAARSFGTLQKVGKNPMGEMTGAQMVGVSFAGTLIHGWDLAKATGQDTRLDPTLCEAAYAIVKPTAEAVRAAKALGAEVKVPADASSQDKLLGLTGRKP